MGYFAYPLVVSSTHFVQWSAGSFKFYEIVVTLLKVAYAT